MNIKLVVVGKVKEKYFRDGISEYEKRLSRFCKFKIVQVSDEKAPESLSEAEMDEVKQKEGERILSKIGEKRLCVCGGTRCGHRRSQLYPRSDKKRRDSHSL